VTVGLLIDPSSAVAATPFGAPERVDDASHLVGTEAATDLDAEGNAVAVWISNGTIYGARRPLGGAWSAPTALVANSTVDAPRLVALREDGSAFFDVSADEPFGHGILIWTAGGTVESTGVGLQDGRSRVETDVDGDVVAYEETPNGSTSFHFAAGGTDPGATGWSSITTLPAFGSSAVSFGARSSYFVAFPPDETGTDRRFTVDLVNGLTGHVTRLLHRVLCGNGSTLAGYDIAAAPAGQAVLAWRCTDRASTVIDALRISRTHDLGRVRQVARSTRSGVVDRLSAPFVAFGGPTPTVLFSKATAARRRDILATSPDGSGGWRRPSVKAHGIRSGAARALSLQLDWSPTGAAVMTYRDGGFGGSVWVVRRLPGAAFRAPIEVFVRSRPTKLASVSADGAVLAARLLWNHRFVTRFAPS
jgi:hypothetical protein